MRGPLHAVQCVCVCHLCFRKQIQWGSMMGNPEQNPHKRDWSATAMLVSALRSASRVQNTNTNCPPITGLLSDRREK